MPPNPTKPKRSKTVSDEEPSTVDDAGILKTAITNKIWREDEGKSFFVQDFYPPSKSATKKVRSDLTMDEVKKHKTRDDAWVIIDGHCYDITDYIDRHPGGWLPICDLAGKDITDAFANYHPARVYQYMLPQYYIGEVVDYEVSDFVKDHRALRQQLLERGLFETNPWYYVMKISILVVLFSSALAVTIFLEQRFIGALLLGSFWHQVAFVGHDVGHNAITHVRKKDLFWGTFWGNLTGGVSLAWWKRSHNVHHIVTNSVENDPDIQHIPLLAVTEKMFKPFFSTYHQKVFRIDKFARFFVSHQHLFFYPIMFFARFNLYLQSWKLVLSKEKIELRTLEIGTLFSFLVWMSLLVASFPTWQDSVMFLITSHGLAGLLHVQITLSHFYMSTYHGRAYNDDSDEWFTMQLKTSMNVDCHPWLDWLHGGLQFQIEHHLWPRLPRHNLREARKLVKPFCKKHGIDYVEPSFFRGNIDMMKHLKQVAQKCSDDENFDANEYLQDSAVSHGVNLLG